MMYKPFFKHYKHAILILASVIFSGCAAYADLNYNKLYGTPEPQQRILEAESFHAQHYVNDVKPIIDNRCVVCHACYDAPCQLKMSSAEGIDRGANKDKV
ncbi:putative isomerase [Photobacterium profundum SS9]|uniref:Isomerase n=1 Tax=Photobacterium profundum (strain SS9) TaxID=298386 RepID=Q6LJI5_PHOPR|nr:putative isomerase [Photobacterium profundum SS9]